MTSLRFALLAVPLLILAGCGGGQENIEEALRQVPVVTPPQPVREIVNGPAIVGTWVSDCAPIENGARFVKLKYEFTNRMDGSAITRRDVVRSVDIFDGADCDHVVDSRMNGGSYVYTQKFANDVYEVEYNLVSSEGFKKHQENIQVFANEIMVTYGSHGNGIAPDISLTRAAAAGLVH